MILHENLERKKKFSYKQIKELYRNEIIAILIVIILLFIIFFTPNLIRHFLSNPPSIVFSRESGFYIDSFEISLKTTSNKSIYYTLDGSIPNYDSNKYENPINIDRTIVVRARIIDEVKPVGEIITKTYFINLSHELPVFSLTTDPYNLWDTNYGIYIGGKIEGDDDTFNNYDQRGGDWERPVHIEYFDVNQERLFNFNGGFRIHGNATRANEQKSLRICTDPKYGSKYIPYSFFDKQNGANYKCFLLRNSGNDWKSTLFKDALIQSLVSDLNFETQLYKPAVVYINGEYWGIHNIREFYDDYYLGYSYGVKRGSIAIIEPDKSFDDGKPVVKYGKDGDEQDYVDLIDYVKENDISKRENYEYVKSKIDIDSFIDYQLVQIFIANEDWKDSNLALWRLKNESYDNSNKPELDGRWRWMLYDTDSGFLPGNNFKNNSLLYATEHKVQWDRKLGKNITRKWPEILLKSLLKNEEFKNQFISRYPDIINSAFLPDRVVSRIDEIHDQVSSEIPRHTQRWGGIPDWKKDITISNAEEWEKDISQLKLFASERIPYTLQHFIEFFNLSGYTKLSLEVSDKKAGSVFINDIEFKEFPKYNLYYFQNIPINLKAKPNIGFKFVRWEADIIESENEIQTYFYKESTYIKAIFKKKY